MIRGTTPLNTFTLKFDCDLIDKIRVLYSQNDTLIFKKTNEDCEFEGNIVRVNLTQEDTFMFDSDKCVEIMLRVKLKNGNVSATKPKLVAVCDCNDDEVL